MNKDEAHLGLLRSIHEYAAQRLRANGPGALRAVEERHGRSLMRGILAGDFPGSPVDLTYDFRVVDDAIESLRIHP